MERSAQAISVQDAKQRLLAWSEQADEELHQQVNGLLESAKAGTRKILPWAAGAALLLGLFSARRASRAGGESNAGDEGPIHKGVRILRTAIRVATIVLPLIRPFFAKRPAE